MLTTSFTTLRRLSGYMLPLLLSSVWLCAGAAAQSPLVVSSSVAAVPHTGTNGAPWQNAVSTHGDFVLYDFKTDGLYEFPGNGGPEITLAAPGVIAGGFTNSGIAIDPRNNNIYLDNNYNGGLIEYPYNPVTHAWDQPRKVVANGLAGNLGGSCGNYFQGAGLAINNNGVMAVATENGCGVEIFTVPIDAAGNFGSATAIVSGMKARARTVAIDDTGNLYWTEDAGNAGALYIPAGVTGLTGETSVTRIDPSLASVQGVAVDRAGNIYVADGNTGVYLVPLESGVPNPAHTVFLTPATAAGNASIDQTHGILFYPTNGFAGIKDDIKIYLRRLELGSVAVGTAGATPGMVYYSFSGTVTPASFAIEDEGTPGDFAIGSVAGCGIAAAVDKTGKPILDTNGNPTFTTTKYAAGSNCTIPVTFSPHTAGDITANLVMLDATGTVLARTLLHGVGQGSATLVAPATESVVGASLKTPSQVAADAVGNIYVADSGLGKVLVYAKGSGTAATPVSIGTGLTAPTGVAVDGAGNVFIADSGNVVEVPYVGAALNAAGQVTLMTGLGSHLMLAADNVGDVFVADPDNQRVVELRGIVDSIAQTTFGGFTQLSAIASDGSGDLFVADGSNLKEITSLGYQSTVLNTQSGANGLAVDASGAVYISSTGGTVRVPNEGGVLNPSHQITIASGVTYPTSVAVDATGNAYVVDGTALNVDFINNSNGSLNFGTLSTTTSTLTAIATILNDGIAPLNITGFSSTADYTETATTCIGAPIAVGASCTATITFNPGPGDQGKLSAQLTVQSDGVYTPVTISVTGVGAALAGSATSFTAIKPTVTNAPIVVTVTPKTGTSPVPTGNVNLVITGNGLTSPVSTTLPLNNGTVTFSSTELLVGPYTFTANYIGDRVYGTSSASSSVTIAPGVVTLTQPAASTVPIYVLASGTGSQEPYDGSQTPFYYHYPVLVKAADGNPLVGIPIYNAKGTLTGYNYGTVSYLTASGSPACPAATINVNADGTAPFASECFTIDTSNTQIPNILTSYTFAPVYNDPNYGSVTGTPVTLIALRNPMVVITSNPASISVSAGSTASATLTVTSLLGYGVTGVNGNLNNYSLPVELECDNLPAHASCTFSYPTPDPSDPNSTAVTPTKAGTVLMTVNTNVAVGTSASLGTHPSETTFAMLFGLGLMGLAVRRKRSLKGLVLTAVSVMLCGGLMAGVTACSSKQLSAAPILTTPTGTYTVTVTAKQTGSKVVPGSQPGTTVTVYGNHNQVSIPFTMSVAVK